VEKSTCFWAEKFVVQNQPQKGGGLNFFLSERPLRQTRKKWFRQISIPMLHMCRVARFFLVQHTKTGKNMPINHKIYQVATKCRKIDQLAVKYTDIFHCKSLKNSTKLGFLVWKYSIWQPWFYGLDFKLSWTTGEWRLM
jgi:hypothetical protein